MCVCGGGGIQGRGSAAQVNGCKDGESKRNNEFLIDGEVLHQHRRADESVLLQLENGKETAFINRRPRNTVQSIRGIF